MKKNLDITIAAQRLGVTERHLRRLCDKGGVSGAVKKDKRWKVPVSADPKLSGIVTPEETVRTAELMNVPAAKRNEAIKRVGIIQDFEKFAGMHVREGGNRTDAMSRYCVENNISDRSLKRWIFKYRLAGLIGLVDTRGRRSEGGAISTEAFDLFKSMYLDQRRLTIKTCWQNVCYVNKSENKDWNIPGLKYLRKFVSDNIPLAVQILHREGMAAYEARCAPYIEIDPGSIEPGQVWVGDHSQFNCWIRDRGKWVRPWITAWQDMRSRAIVGRQICLSPNQTTILQAMKRGLEKYGPPDSAKIDNGKDYDSELFTGTTKARRKAIAKGYLDEPMIAGIYAMMNITVSFAIPYHPQSKPIERFFDTLDRQFTKTIDTYCGKDTDRKPDYIKDMLGSEKAVHNAYDLESFTAMVDKYIEAHNNTAHSGRGMDDRSPNEVIALRTSRRVMAEGVLDLLMRVWSGELTVGKNGVRVKGLWYGQYNTELMQYQGKKVRVSYDPDDMRQVYVYHGATMKLLTIADQARLVGWGSAVNEEHLRFAMKQKARAVRTAKEYKDTRLTANMDLTSLTIAAMEDAAQAAAEQQEAVSARLVRTPMDGQVKEHRRREIQSKFKKAAGAESMSSDLGINLSSLIKKESNRDLGLFGRR